MDLSALIRFILPEPKPGPVTSTSTRASKPSQATSTTGPKPSIHLTDFKVISEHSSGRVPPPQGPLVLLTPKQLPHQQLYHSSKERELLRRRYHEQSVMTSVKHLKREVQVIIGNLEQDLGDLRGVLVDLEELCQNNDDDDDEDTSTTGSLSEE